MAENQYNTGQSQGTYGQEGQPESEGQSMFAQATERINEAVENVGEKVGHMGEKVGHMMDTGREQARQTFNSVRDQGNRAVENVQHRVEQHPMTAMATTLAAGFILGFVVSQMISWGREDY